MAPAHADGLRRLVREAFDEAGLGLEDRLDGDLLDPPAADAAAWVAVAQGEVVGSVALCDQGEGVLRLTRMYVDAGCRGAGIGRALLATAIGWARAAGMSAVRLDTAEDMAAARRLYESAGFRRAGERQGGRRRAGGPLREVLYELSLAGPPGDDRPGVKPPARG